MDHILCRFCGGALRLRGGVWSHVAMPCGKEPEPATTNKFLALHPDLAPPAQANATATCGCCQTTGELDTSVPPRYGHPEGWVEGVYDPAQGTTYPWCCVTCAERVLGPDRLRLGPNGEVLTLIRDRIVYICPFCKTRVPDLICEGCGGISGFAVFPLSLKERAALHDRNGLLQAEEPTVTRLIQRGIMNPEGSLTPLGLTLQVLLQANQQAVMA